MVVLCVGVVWYGHVLWFRTVFYGLLKLLYGLAVIACLGDIEVWDWMAMEPDQWNGCGQLVMCVLAVA